MKLRAWMIICLSFVLTCAARAADEPYRRDPAWVEALPSAIQWKEDWESTYTANRSQWLAELAKRIGRPAQGIDPWLRVRLIVLNEALLEQFPQQVDKQPAAWREIAENLDGLEYREAAQRVKKQAIERSAGRMDVAVPLLTSMLQAGKVVGQETWEDVEFAATRILALHALGQVPEGELVTDATRSLCGALRRQGRFAEAADVLDRANPRTREQGWWRMEHAALLTDAGYARQALAIYQEIAADLAGDELKQMQERMAALADAPPVPEQPRIAPIQRNLTPDAMLAQAEQALRKGRIGPARRWLTDAIAQDPSLAKAPLNWLGPPAPAADVLKRPTSKQATPGAAPSADLKLPPRALWPGNLLDDLPQNLPLPRTAVQAAGAYRIVAGPALIACFSADGKLIWQQRAKLGGGVQGRLDWPAREQFAVPGSFAPAIDGGRVYTRWGLDSSDRYCTAIAAFEFATGRMLWTTDGASGRALEPLCDPAFADECLYVLCAGDAESPKSATLPVWLACLDAATGEVVWQKKLGELRPAIALSADSPIHGRKSADRADVARFGNALAVVDGEVYCSTNMGLVARCDARDGAIEWAFAYPRARLGAGSAAILAKAGESPVVTADRVAFNPRDRNGSFVLERSSGKLVSDELFATPANAPHEQPDDAELLPPGTATAAPAAPLAIPLRELWHIPGANPRLLVPPPELRPTNRAMMLADGMLIGIDPSAGRVLWRRDARTPFQEVLWAESSTLLVQAGALLAIDPATGAVQWRAAVPLQNPWVRIGGRQVFVADGSRDRAEVTALDLKTGQLKWRRADLPIGPRPWSGTVCMATEGDDLHLVGRRGDPTKGDFWDVLLRGSDGSVLASWPLLPRSLGQPNWLAMDGLKAAMFNEGTGFFFVDLREHAPSADEPAAPGPGMGWGWLIEISSVGDWGTVHWRDRPDTWTYHKGVSGKRAPGDRPLTYIGGRAFDVSGHAITPVELPTPARPVSYHLPVPASLDHHTQLVDLWEDGPSIFVVSGTERGTQPAMRRPADLRIDQFDTKTGDHLAGQVLPNVGYWHAYMPAGNGQEMLRQTQAARCGNVLLVTDRDGVHGFGAGPAADAPAEPPVHISYHRPPPSSQPVADTTEAWPMKGAGSEGTLRLCHDDTNLYVSVSYQDAAVVPRIGRGFWGDGDWLEVGLCTTAGTYHLGLGVDETGQPVLETLDRRALPRRTIGASRHDLLIGQHIYDLTIPLASIIDNPGGDQWRSIGLSVAVWEAGLGNAAILRFGGGLDQRQLDGRSLARIWLHPLSPPQNTAAQAIVDAMPLLAESQEYIRRLRDALCPTPAAATSFARDYLRRHPADESALQMMAWLDQRLRQRIEDDPTPVIVKLAADCGVSEGIRARYAVAAAAYISQRVLIDPDGRPDMLMLQFNDGTGWEHRVSFGQFSAVWDGEPHTPSRRIVGKLPPAGSWQEIRIPLIWLDLHDKPIGGVSFGQSGGQAVLWDRTAIVAGGKERVFIEDEPPAGKTAGLWIWTDQNKCSGAKAHLTPGPVTGEAATRQDAYDFASPVRDHLPPTAAPPADATQALAVLEQQLPLLGPTDEAVAFLHAMLRLTPPGQRVARYKWFLLAIPNHPRTNQVLGGFLTDLRQAKAPDAEAQVEAAISECKVPLRARYAYRRAFTHADHAFLSQWQVAGPFANVGGRGLEMAYPPETQPFRLDAALPSGNDIVRWKLYQARHPIVDLSEAAGIRESSVAYAACWVFTERAKAVSLELGAAGAAKVWVNRKPVASAESHDWARPGEGRFTVLLPAGWSELLVKVAQTGNEWGFYAEFVDAEGRGPLTDVRLSPTPP